MVRGSRQSRYILLLNIIDVRCAQDLVYGSADVFEQLKRVRTHRNNMLCPVKKKGGSDNEVQYSTNTTHDFR